MPDLIAQGAQRKDRWRRRVPAGEVISIGRMDGAWTVPWDEHISRLHIKVRWETAGSLHVEKLPKTQNPVFFQGVEVQSFHVRPGEHFVIGQTTFTLADDLATINSPLRPPVTEQFFSHDYLRDLHFRNPSDRLDILSKLPERLATATDNTDLFENLIRVVFEGIPAATAVAICETSPETPEEVEFLHWDQPSATTLSASRKLIQEATSKRQSVVHTWESSDEPTDFTEVENVAWAFCTPFVGATTSRWALYVAGSELPKPDSASVDVPDLREEMKFAEIVATTVASFHEVRQLHQHQASLGQFFSAPVIRALQLGNAEETLSPREVDVTVLFCDLRGFSLATEKFADDLLGLLQRVSDALGVLTNRILHEGGVIGDFHGDAAMGFWGWPLSQHDAAHRAARAALGILEEFSSFASESEHPLARFRIGIGMASGRVVAGKIGTKDQVKVTAFGPAVNLASRLEGITKHLNAPILLDAATARQLQTSANETGRLRRLAIVQPYGMEAAIEVYELLPSAEAYPLLTQQHIQHYELALDAFVAGDWSTAWEELHEVPAADPSKDFLTTYIASRSRVAPDNWSGVIRLDSK